MSPVLPGGASGSEREGGREVLSMEGKEEGPGLQLVRLPPGHVPNQAGPWVPNTAADVV